MRRESARTTARNIVITLDAHGEKPAVEWRKLAACNGHDPSVFFPAGESGPAAIQIHLAKKLCESCVVSQECLLYAIETNQVAGIWGGLTEDERRPVRRRWLADRRRRNVG